MCSVLHYIWMRKAPPATASVPHPRILSHHDAAQTQFDKFRHSRPLALRPQMHYHGPSRCTASAWPRPASARRASSGMPLKSNTATRLAGGVTYEPREAAAASGALPSLGRQAAFAGCDRYGSSGNTQPRTLGRRLWDGTSMRVSQGRWRTAVLHQCAVQAASTWNSAIWPLQVAEARDSPTKGCGRRRRAF
ncbi:hypothetical protein K458DRAFT_485978 [Lentithecium fluviatile CBS 122367]|uniref:Uncharacterized protein n=1 Tax=Lentithecium fluviatile CBS 122367 TaxID=1168545 RepID=A0A6G1J9G3_9PLEO|nr:hypothetical protein K458DRAFT_485978 [Lentithecium fluviatile CBS 122367]